MSLHTDVNDKMWFTETGVLNASSFRVNVAVKQILHQETSEFQDILLFDSEKFGRCLVLDNAIQCTELDQVSYQEMMAFLPLNVHPNPKRVLVIGGGDGGIVREVVKHPLVENVVLCEIDERVVQLSKQYLPFMSSALDDEKVTVVYRDGLKYLQNNDKIFDVIITDSSDPTGPATSLFGEKYYDALRNSLDSGGVICSQGENIWLDIEITKSLIYMCSEKFANVAYASINVPTYPFGQIGFVLASKDIPRKFNRPILSYPFRNETLQQCQYYNEAIHEAAFALPTFALDKLRLHSQVIK